MGLGVEPLIGGRRREREEEVEETETDRHRRTHTESQIDREREKESDPCIIYPLTVSSYIALLATDSMIQRDTMNNDDQ